MTIPDWTKADSTATHWDTRCHFFCKANYFWLGDGSDGAWHGCYHVDWGTDRYTARPTAEDKIATAGWRPEGLITRHEQRFKSQLKDITMGDHLPNVKIEDHR